MSNTHSHDDALNAYAAAAELSFLRTDDGIGFAAMPARSFVERVEKVLRFHCDRSDEGQAIAVQAVVRERLLKEIGTQGLRAQFRAIHELLGDIDDSAEDLIGAPAFGAVTLVQSTVEGLEQFILDQIYADAA